MQIIISNKHTNQHPSTYWGVMGMICLFLLLPFTSFSSEEDSLLGILKFQKDTSRINTLNTLAWYYNTQHDEKSESIGKAALEESLQIRYSFGIAQAHRNLANFYQQTSNFSEAQNHLFKSLKIAEKTNSKVDLLKTYIGLGNLYFKIDEYKKADKFYKKALFYALEIASWDYYAILCNNIGQIHESQNEPRKAKEYYLLGLSKEDPTLLSPNYFTLLQNIGSAYYYLDQTDSAIFYNSIVKNYYSSQNDKSNLAGCFLNEGVYIESTGNYQNAIQVYKEGLELIEGKADLILIQNFYENIMLCYGYLCMPDSLDHYFSLNYDLNLEIIRKKTTKAIHEVSIKYDVEKKEIALIIAQKENEKAALSNELKQRTIYGLLAIIAIIGLVVVIFYILIREKQKLIEMEVHSKNNEIEKLIKDQEIKTYKAQLEGIEKERKRVAQDLHDKIGGLLATVKLQFEGEEGLNNQSIENVKSLINESIKSVRSISHNLSDGRVDEMGLRQAVESLKDSFSSPNSLSFDLYLENYTSQNSIEKEREIFKIILELLSNTLKHAEATNIVLQLSTLEHNLQLTFEDNGVGFDQGNVKKGLGIKSISKRVDQLNGSWYIDSKPGHGSTIVIKIPCT